MYSSCRLSSQSSVAFRLLAAVAAVLLPELARGNQELSKAISLDGKGWLLATDAKNQGRAEKWYAAPVSAAKPAPVPWVIQDVFPDYHGVAWYWRDFTAPDRLQPAGRYLIKFHAVDYLAEVWVNGTFVGGHEGSDTPFVIDVTHAVKQGQSNRLAVRVLNPTYEPIDGITLKQTASGAKQYPVATNIMYNSGGIVDSVELLVVPAVRIEDLYLAPDWRSGEIRVRATVRNAAPRPARGSVELSVAPASGGGSLDCQPLAEVFAPGETQLEGRLRVANHRLWQPSDPFLYRVAARVRAEGTSTADEQAVRCGFRDFRFDRGYFRLNGKRTFLHGVIHMAHFPVGYTCPADPDWLRQDVLHMKVAGVNLCRIAFGGMPARQLDVFDELGVMVYMEHFASWQTQQSPQMKQRFERSLGETILRDRNHPSIVAWGMLNETAGNDPAFRCGVEALPLVRRLDPGRLCFLSSGRWDANYTTGSLSNPGSATWESDLRDVHGYPPVPHPAKLLRSMRTSGTPETLWSESAQPARPAAPSHPLFVSEYGQCGAVDLARALRRYEQLGKQQADDARYFRRQMDKFLVDWQAWGLARIWARPEDFFTESHANFVKLRQVGENALRANPHLVGFNSTYPITDLGFCGSGATNAFRELKPGLLDAAYDLAAPLRWCLFVEPVNIYRGTRVKLEAVLANDDVLRPGKYPVRLQVVGPAARPVWEKMTTLEIPNCRGGREPPFALPVFADEVLVDGPSGKYRFLATFLEGAAAMGGQTEFHVVDPAGMPAITKEVLLWGDDAGAGQWLAGHGVRTRQLAQGSQTAREVILASGRPPAPGGAAAFTELRRRIARGSTVVFLDASTFRDGKDATRWLPLKRKGRLAPINWVGGYYRADVWAKDHPIFAGLPAGGILDPVVYRELLPQQALLRCYTTSRPFTEEEATAELDQPAEAVCGANRLSANYASGLHVAVYRLGAGRFIFNNLLIRENLGRVPVAERLLRNMLIYAGQETGKPLAELPPDTQAASAPDNLRIELSEPATVAMAPPRIHGWGPYQFPGLARLPDGRIQVSFHVEADSAAAYGLPPARAISADEGKSWSLLPREEAKNSTAMSWGSPPLCLPNGDLLTAKQLRSRPVTGLKLPEKPRAAFPTYGVTVAYYRVADLSDEYHAGWLLSRLRAGQKKPKDEQALVRLPGETRWAQGGFLAFPWFQEMFLAPDGAMWAVNYDRRIVDGKVQDKICAMILRSSDGGHTFDLWSEIPYSPDSAADPKAAKREGFTEPAVAFMPDGSVLCLLRTTDGNGVGPLYWARSTDNGKTWTHPAVFDDLGVWPQMLTLSSGVTLAVYGRPGLYVRATADPAGLQWERRVVVVPPGGLGTDTCSYAALLPLSQDTALLAYSNFKLPNAGGILCKGIQVRKVTVTRAIKRQ
jgi:hypothetical protein